MLPNAPWRPMSTAPQTVERIWLNHLTLGPIQAEGRNGRWYAPSAAQQVWRWHRPADPNGLKPFSGWLPFAAFGPEQDEQDLVRGTARFSPPVPTAIRPDATECNRGQRPSDLAATSRPCL